MLQLENHTPFAVDIALFPNERGIDTLYTLVKATFVVGSSLTLAPQQFAPQKKDVFLADPAQSSLLLPSDYHTGKSATDIFMTGTAFSPDAQAVYQMDVILRVAELAKTLRVIGDRVWHRGYISAPEPFVEMPLIYERAYGGSVLVGGEVHQQEDRNPVGLGFTGDFSVNDMDDWPLPNLEYPHRLIRHWGDAPAPACFAPVAGHWRPRSRHAGTYDDVWQKSKAPFLPDDYNPRFMNAAPEDQIYPGFLQGGEPVFIRGMHTEGDLSFSLPNIHLKCQVHLGGSLEQAPFVLETLILNPNEKQFSLVWRSAYPCDKRALKIDRVHVSL